VLELTSALIVVALMRHGGFYPPDDAVLPATATALAVLAAGGAWQRLTRRDACVVAAIALFVLWWWLQAHRHGSWMLSRQAAGSAVGFGACFVIGRTLGPVARERLRGGALLVGTLMSVVGLVGLALRIWPLALPAQAHLRLAGTLTYSNATAALLVMILLAGLTAPVSRLRDPQLTLVLGGLLATQSRGGYVALVLGLLVVRRQAIAAAMALGLGGALGIAAVARSAQGHRQVELLFLMVVVAALSSASTGIRRPSAHVLGAAAAAIVVATVLALTIGGLGETVRSRASTASVSDRGYEWRAGWDNVAAHPLRGAGPGNRLQLSDGRTARFVHNEPLQVAADSGLVGLGLLTLAAVGGVLLRRHDEPRVGGAAAVLVGIGVCGLVDFSWHLPGIAMSAGLLAAGLPLSRSRFAEVSAHSPIRANTARTNRGVDAPPT
jgi:hypothetical protein